VAGRVALVAVVLGVLACGPTLGDQREKAQRKLLLKYMPATLETPQKYDGEIRTAKVRVYADNEYRLQNLRWEDRFGDELDYANQLLQPMLGVRLEPQFVKWDRQQGETLQAVLDELKAKDKGDDVAWVFGLTGSLDMVSVVTDELGMAYDLDGWIVLRGFSDAAERKMFEAALPDLSAAERAELFEARHRHKQASILIHMLGHTLGAVHETDESWLMYRQYNKDMARESDKNRDLMLMAIEDRLRPGVERKRADVAAKQLAMLEATDWGGWDPADRQRAADELRKIVDVAKSGKTADDVPAAIYAQYQRALALATGGKLDEAVAELEPLIAAYPANANLRILLCQIELKRGGPSAEPAQKACDRAVDLAGGDPKPHIWIASAFLANHDIAGARKQLLLAEAKVPNLAAPNDGWLELARAYQGMGAIAWAEAAIGKTGAGEHEIIAWAKTTRARYGVPATGKYAVAPEEEAAAVTAVRQILDAVYANKFSDAEKAARAAEKKWPKLPGLAAARCDLELRQEQVDAAKRKCNTAIAAYPDASWAQYLAGIIELRKTSAAATTSGIDHLKLAIAADPELGQAWRALAKAYARAKDDDALKQLGADYQARFGQALPN
jgi:hypothetical protein